jgi:hypothetical protein
MRGTRHTLGIAVALLAAACGGGGGGGGGDGGGGGGSNSHAFVHTAVAGNSGDNYSWIDHPLLNGNPTVAVFVTHAVNPGGAPLVTNPHHLGVFYVDGLARWAVFNQDGADMPLGAGFHVCLPGNGSVLLHVATLANIPDTNDHATTISHPDLDGNAGARFLVTPSWEGSGSGVYDDHSIGAWYDGTHWNVFNQDFAAMPLGAAFNVYVPPPGDLIVHTADVSNIVDEVTFIDHPDLNDDPDAVPVVTQLYNRPGLPGVYNAEAISVAYQPATGLWMIANADGTNMPEGASFFVRVR